MQQGTLQLSVLSSCFQLTVQTLSCGLPLHSIQHKKHVAPTYSNANTGKCQGLQNKFGSKILLTPSFIQISTFIFTPHIDNNGNNSSYRNIHNRGNNMNTLITITTVTLAAMVTNVTKSNHKNIWNFGKNNRDNLSYRHSYHVFM